MKLNGIIWGQLTPAFQMEGTEIDNYQEKSTNLIAYGY